MQLSFRQQKVILEQRNKMQFWNNMINSCKNILVVLFANTIFALTLSSDQLQSKWSSSINMALESFHISKEFVILVARKGNFNESTSATSFPASVISSSRSQLNKTTGDNFYGKLTKSNKVFGMDKMIEDFHSMTGGVMLLRVEPLLDRGVVENTHRRSSGRMTTPVVFLLQDEKQPMEVIQPAMAMLSLLESWSPRAPHLVALKDEDETSNGTIAQVLGELWRHKVSRAAVLQQGRQGFVLRWWAPQGHGRDCEGPSTEGLVAMELSFHAARRALPRRRPYNYFSGCVLHCSTFLWLPYSIGGDGGRIVDGLDFRVLETVRKRMNFTTIYSLPHEKYNDAGLNVSNGNANFTLGAFYLADSFYPAMDPTVAYWQDSTVWFVPTGLPIPRWLSVTRVFSGYLWLGVLVSCILAAGGFTISSVLYERFGYRGPRAADAIRMLLGIHAQEPRTPIARWIFTVWLFSSLIINFAYQSGLIGFLANPGMFPSLSTVEELIERKMKILIHPEYDTVLEELGDPIINTLLKNGVPCEDILLCIHQVASSQDYILPIEEGYINYGFKGEERTKIKILSDILSYSIHTYTQKGSPLLEWFDFYITGVVEGNLNRKWWNEVIGSKEPLGQQSISRSDSKPVKMSVEHLQGVFFILLFGFAASSATFITEVLYYFHALRKFANAE